MDTGVLEEIGFSENEIKVFLALLRGGTLSATELSEKAGVDRTLCYSVLSKLIDRGFASFVVSEGAKRFRAVEPQRVLDDLHEKEHKLEQLMPDLVALAKKPKEETRVEILRGKRGISALFADCLSAGIKEYKLFGDVKNFQMNFPIELRKFLRELEKRKITEKLLFAEYPGVLLCKTSKMRYVPEQLVSPSSTWMYADRVIIVIWSEPIVTVMIRNKDLAKTYRAYFDLMWKSASKARMPGLIQSSGARHPAV